MAGDGKSGSGFDLKSYLARRREEVDRELDRVLPRPDRYPFSLREAMRYSVFAGGKRLRPVLCLAGCEAVGGDPKPALPVAAAIEMIHTYSLIHDDLPAMDDDDLRRGMPTCHKKFGEAVAILAGDALLTEAFRVIAAAEELLPELRNRLIVELVQAAGVSGMVSGQVADMEKEGAEFTEEDVEFIHSAKTAAMISFSTAAGGMVGGGREREIQALRDYGLKLGLAFQIKDDVLNITGGKETGKGVGTDQARGKATYPALFGVEASLEKARALCEQAKERLKLFPGNTEPLSAIADYIVERDR